MPTPHWNAALTFTIDPAIAGGGRFAIPHGFLTPELFAPIARVGTPGETLVDAATIALDAATSGIFDLTCTTDDAREFQVPTGGYDGQIIHVIIRNESSGALTLTTFHTDILQGSLTFPADGTFRVYSLMQLAGSAEWVVYAQSAVDLS